jgi:hypothetical protein
MNPAGQAERARGPEQEGIELGRPLLVSPVADPDQIPIAGLARDRTEDPRVGGLVPGPGARRPPLAQVEVADHAAEREDAVVARQVVGGHGLAGGRHAVVRIMEEQAVAAGVVLAVLADAPHQRVIVPLVDQDEIGAVQGPVDIQSLEVVPDAPEPGIGGLEPFQGELAVRLGEEVPQAPGIARLEDPHVVAAGQKLAGDAAQEVRVAMVPVRQQRVDEEDDAHAPALVVPGQTATWCSNGCSASSVRAARTSP